MPAATRKLCACRWWGGSKNRFANQSLLRRIMSWIADYNKDTAQGRRLDQRRSAVADRIYRHWNHRLGKIENAFAGQIWASVDIQSVKKCPIAIQRYVEELRQYCPEWVHFVQFKLSTSEEFDLLASQRLLKSIQFCRRFCYIPSSANRFRTSFGMRNSIGRSYSRI